AVTGSMQAGSFKVMERRLLKAIINPAMIVTWLSGLYLAWVGHWFSAPWLHGKLLLVVVLSGVHGFFSRWVKDFAADRNTRSQRFYRFINEVPTIVMIGIVILVVVKPFEGGEAPIVRAPGLLAESQLIFYISEIPPHAG